MQAQQVQPGNANKKIDEQPDIIKETKRLVANKNQQQRFEIARKHLFNALDYKTPRLDIQEETVSPVLKAIYHVQTHYIWRGFLLLLAYLFMYAAFFGHVRPSYTLIGIQLGILFFLFLDIFMEVYHKKSNRLRHHSSFQARFYIKLVTLILLLADEIVCLSTQALPIRLFLVFRCVLPVIYDPQVRKMLYALFSAYIDIFVYLIFYTLVIIVFAIMANQFIQFPGNQVYDNLTGNYPALGKAIFIMYVLTTFDAYPDNQLVAIRVTLWIYGFFIIFIFLNALFFVTIPTNILLNSIKDTRSKTIIIDQIEQQHNLIMAFIALGGDSNRRISYGHLVKFLLYVFNNEARYVDVITEICKNLDEKVDGTIQVTQFMQLCKIIQSKNYLRPPRYRIWKRLAPFQSFVHNTLGLKDFIKSTKFQLMVAIFVVISFVNCILTMYVDNNLFDIIDDVIMIIIVIEIVFKFVGLGPELYFNSILNIVDLVVVVVGIFLETAPVDIIPRNAGVFIKMFRIFRISLLVRYFTGCCNITYQSELFIKLARLFNQLAIVIPIVLKFFPLYMITFYFLGAVGVQIFWRQTEILPEDSSYSAYDQFSNFRTLLGSQFVFVQVLTEAGWSLIAYDHAYRYGTFALTMLFFVISHELIVIILTSLLKGITWQVYNSIAVEQEQYLNRMADNQKNFKALKKRLDIIEEVRQKIERQENLKPDNLISRELYQKKIDRQILLKLIDLEIKNKGTMFYHKKKKQSKDGNAKPDSKTFKLKKFDSILIGASVVAKEEENPDSAVALKQVSSSPNMAKQFLSKKQESPAGQFLKPPEEHMLNNSQQKLQEETKIDEGSESSIEIEELKEQDIEKQIDELLNEVILHSGIKFSLKIEHPQPFLDFLAQKLKPIAIGNFEKQFDSDRDVFAKKQSMILLAHGLHTLLQIETSDREQRRLVLNEMMHRGVITEEKAKKMLLEKSDYEDETKFDYNWIIRKTYLSNVSEKVIDRFETEYFSAVYGESFKQINKVTIYPLIRVEARIHYCFSNLLRYREISTSQFFNILTHIENKISTKLLKRGSLCKFVYQIDTNSETWFTVELKDSNELRVHFIKNGLWICNEGMDKDQIYVARDAFNWESINDRNDKDQAAKYIKRFFQSFESLAFCINDFETFFTPQPEKQIYDLYSFYREVQGCKRFVKKQLSISKIMIVLLSKEQERNGPVPYDLSDINYEDEELEKYKEFKKKPFRLDETEKQTFDLLKKIEELGVDEISDSEGLPYSYLVNFLINIREIMTLNQRNFVFHAEKLLNQHFKAEQNVRSETGGLKRRASVKPKIH